MFKHPPGSKYLNGELVTVVSKLRLALGDVWAQRGLSTCITVPAGNLFVALRHDK